MDNGAHRRVLVVEDEPRDQPGGDRPAARRGLRGRGRRTTARRGRGGAAGTPDLLVLDVMLPGFDGLEVCRRIQADRPVPVLMLTARDDETDLLVGLGVGADDYLTKPFSMRELVARVRALLRRVERAAELAARRRDRSTVGAAARSTRPPAGCTVDGDGRAPHPDRVRPAGLPGAPARARCSPASTLLAEVWDWPDAAGHPHRRQPREGAARASSAPTWSAPCTASATRWRSP